MMFEITLEDGVTVTGSHDNDGNPIVTFENVPRILGKNTFRASQVISRSKDCEPFSFASNFDDQWDIQYTVPKETVEKLACLIMENYEKRNGHFEYVFVNTRGLPF